MIRLKRLLHLLLLTIGIIPPAHAAVDFNRDVRPILSNRCFKCHGPDDKTREGGLRLDTTDALSPAKSGATAIVPGKPNESELLHRINSTDPDDLMPPATAKMEMPETERKILKQWIEQGAPYDPHWAFIPPKKSTPPKISGAPHPIDAFLLQKLASHPELTLSAPADKATLARRASIDLTGLPPSIEEADAYLNDTSPRAWEKYIDRLLAAPAYGERWARRWMDLARYADTNGYEKDRPRNIWPWRDWLIRSLNADMPFDEFTIKQLAGDMLPHATEDDRIATGFHRNSMLNEEGGIDPLEYRFHALNDRVATTGTAWLGMTLACAQCHTHKYDPILHTEYYQIMAFLNNSDDYNLDLPDPTLFERLQKNQEEARAILTALPSKWPLSPGSETSSWQTSLPLTLHSEAGQIPQTKSDQSIHFTGKTPERDTYTLTYESNASHITQLRLETLIHPENPDVGPGKTHHGNFVLSEIEIETQPANQPSASWYKLQITSASASFEQDNYPIQHAFDSNPNTGWAIAGNKKQRHSNQFAIFQFANPVPPNAKGTRFRIRLAQNFGSMHVLERIKISLGTPYLPNDPKLQKLEKLRVQSFDAAHKKHLQMLRKHTVDWTPLSPTSMESNEPILTLESEHIIFVSGDITKNDRFTLTFENLPKNTSALRIEALPDPRLPFHGPGMTYYEGAPGDFFLQEIKASSGKTPLPFASASAAYGDNARLCIDGDFQTGWSGAGYSGEENQAVFEFATPINTAQNPLQQLRIDLHMGRHYASSLGKFRISFTTTPATTRARVLPPGGEETLKADPHTWTKSQHQALLDHFLLNSPELSEHTRSIRAKLKPISPPYTLALRQRDPVHSRTTRLHKRGEYTQPQQEVQPGVPAFLPPLKPGTPPDRLTFARWLVSPQHPLTARVTVNRHWQAFFGTGIVKTLDDFGYQSEAPSHQELLDWLAVTFMEQGWSVKQLHRLIVTSEAYQRSAITSAEQRALDPENRLLARGPRQRAEAEMIRDIIFKTADLLSPTMFGPPVKPPQPASVTESAYNGKEWTPSTGDDRNRRALYTFIKRTAPFATYQTFDAPNGEACIARRPISNTPLQSLALLNDEAFTEAARAFGILIDQRPGSRAEKIRFAFRKTLIRTPESVEFEKLETYFLTQLSRLKNGELHPKEILANDQATEEQAAWTLLARVLLNLDETFNK